MRDHRQDMLEDGAPRLTEITEQVHAHSTKHPGSVKRTATSKAKRKQAKVSRRANRR